MGGAHDALPLGRPISLSQQSNNQNIASVILATRPYGATPLAGMFKDAKNYFWTDPTGPELTDTFVHCGTRPEYIIVLTDGAPNLDMRDDCSNKAQRPRRRLHRRQLPISEARGHGADPLQGGPGVRTA